MSRAILSPEIFEKMCDSDVMVPAPLAADSSGRMDEKQLCRFKAQADK